MTESTQDPSAEAPRRGPAARLGALLGDPVGRMAVVGLLAVLPLLWAMSAPRLEQTPPPPVLLRVPAFELVDQAGEALGSEQLRGAPWVGSVFFTRCPTVCPALLAEIRSLELDTRVAAPSARFVNFSADPVHDTPEVLRAHAAGLGTTGERWVFLTGEEQRVRSAVLEGLKIGLGEDGEAPFGIFHATHLVLVDSRLNVRGYYRGDSREELDQLARDLIVLERLQG